MVPASLGSDVHVLLLQDEPVARGGSDQNVTIGSTAVLNGSASSGFEGPAALNYTWNISYAGSRILLYGMNVTFVANESGLAEVNLTVRDSQNRSDYDRVNVVVKEKPKTWLEKNLISLIVGGILAAIALIIVSTAVLRILRGDPVVSPAGKEKFKLGMKRTKKTISQLLHNPMGVVGIAILVFFIGMAAFGPAIAPYDVYDHDLSNKYTLPDKNHWLGRDNFGVDIFSELLHGARTSMIVGVVSAIIASFLGAGVGLYSGYVGGWKDEAIMRLNDIVLSIPWLVLMIIVAAMVGKIDLTGIILIIGLTGWSTTARMVRAQVLSVKERQYIERARAIGASETSIIRRHIFPNTFPLVFANTILTVAVSILSEATLSFLGLRPVGVVTWGTMLSFASGASAFQIGLHWWILAPGLCIVAVVLGFTLLGYALDEILNPKLRHR
jgi:peptide/nickel transport system permease protein